MHSNCKIDIYHQTHNHLTNSTYNICATLDKIQCLPTTYQCYQHGIDTQKFHVIYVHITIRSKCWIYKLDYFLSQTIESTKNLIETIKVEIEKWGSQDKELGSLEIEYMKTLLNKDYVLRLSCSKNVYKENSPSRLWDLFYHHVTAILGWKGRVPKGDAHGINPMP